jgi:trk system potassium uptake protein TrkA
LVHLGDGHAEVIEVVAALGSPITSGPLSDIKLPAGVSIGAVSSAHGVCIACGNTVVEAGDTVVVLALEGRHNVAEKLFKRGMF